MALRFRESSITKTVFINLAFKMKIKLNATRPIGRVAKLFYCPTRLANASMPGTPASR